jgi:serine/threonine protein phosphatase 1
VLYHIDDHKNCFVHGGFNRYQAFDEQREETYYWDRSLFLDAVEFEQLKTKLPDITFEIVTSFNTIYIGHTSTIIFKKDQPIHAANIINLDTGSGWGGRLSIMEVETKELWQSDPVVDLYGHRGR